MAFTLAEQQDIRYYLGRASDQQASEDWPYDYISDSILVLTPEAEARVRGLLQMLRNLETTLTASIACAGVTQVDGAKFDPDTKHRLMMSHARRLTKALAGWIGVTVYRSPLVELTVGGAVPRGG